MDDAPVRSTDLGAWKARGSAFVVQGMESAPRKGVRMEEIVDPEETAESRWQILLLFEFTLLAISFVSPITPSKTGSDRGLAHAFLESPSYLEEVAVSFLALHVLLLAIGVVSFVVFRLRRARDGKGRRAGRGRRQRPKRRR